jgi:hypothetical protein
MGAQAPGQPPAPLALVASGVSPRLADHRRVDLRVDPLADLNDERRTMDRTVQKVIKDLERRRRTLLAELANIEDAVTLLKGQELDRMEAAAKPKPKRRRTNVTRSEVRDAVLAIEGDHPGDSFTLVNVAERLGVTRGSGTVRAEVTDMVRREALVRVKRSRDRWPRYRYNTKAAGQAPPHAVESRTLPQHEQSAPSGRMPRKNTRELNRLLVQLRQQGFKAKRTKGGAYRVTNEQGGCVVVDNINNPRSEAANRERLRQIGARV